MAKSNIVCCLEFAGKQYFISDIERKARTLIRARHGNNVGEIALYLQPEVGFVYYTLDGVGNDESHFTFDDLL